LLIVQSANHPITDFKKFHSWFDPSSVQHNFAEIRLDFLGFVAYFAPAF